MLIGEGTELPAEVGLGPWVHAFVKKSAQLAIPQKIEVRTFRIGFSGWSTPEAFCFFRADLAVGRRPTGVSGVGRAVPKFDPTISPAASDLRPAYSLALRA
jgi:hypothetical protein